LLSAAGTALVWQCGYVLTGQAGAAWFGWAVVALTAPSTLLASLIYPDPVAGCVLAGGLLALALASRGRPWSIFGTLLLGAAIGALPWLHTRLALPGAGLAALVALRIVSDRSFREHRWRHLAAFVGPGVLVVAAWLLFFRTIHHTLSPVS